MASSHTNDLSDLIHDFSSEEVSVENQDILLSISVPVPNNYRVQYFDFESSVQSMFVRRLPPIEVRLAKPENPTDNVDFIATVTCCWMNFKQCRLVGAILDRLWEKGGDLTGNIERLLDSAGLKVFHDVKLAPGLDLTWRKPVDEDSSSKPNYASWAKKAPTRHKRRDGGLGVMTCTDMPRCEKVGQTFLKQYDQSSDIDHLVAGQERIPCSCCCEDVLPTRVVVFRGCSDTLDSPTPHHICRSCFVRSVRSNVHAQVTCKVYGCDGTLLISDVACHFRNDVTVYRDILNNLFQLELASVMGDRSYVKCFWCQQMVGPRSFLESLQLQNCRWCHRCFCSECISATDESLLSKRCLYAIGVELNKLMDAGDEKIQEFMFMFGERKTKQAAEFYNQQILAADNYVPCPGCHIAAEKTYGCNKMTCASCHTNFCFKCGVKISQSNPYKHFEDNPDCQGVD